MPTLRCSREIAAPAHEVWRILTTNEIVKEWAAAYMDGLSIQTTWKAGDKFTWKTSNGTVRASGRIAAFEPDRLLQFDYDQYGPAEGDAFSATFEIHPGARTTRLNLTAGPMNESTLTAMRGPAENAIEEIRSLAEELAQIRRAR
ncbi:SRPBCC domain-containing protein [Phenylobacterium sp.]|jgi:uncharacterized protein YndB with AHSA1/START domain|uniref:SRPBCC domain-containing protein n=1 Tax=Phenylobacterium sp. TaxID=1871053 RepID=UPI0037C8ECE3